MSDRRETSFDGYVSAAGGGRGMFNFKVRGNRRNQRKSLSRDYVIDVNFFTERIIRIVIIRI